MYRDAKHAACLGAEEILWSKYNARGAELARLRAEVEDSQRRINEIRDDCERRLAIRDEEVEKLRADVVWAVRHQTEFYVDDDIWSFLDSTGKRQYRQFGDGTDASLLSAVRRGREGTDV